MANLDEIKDNIIKEIGSNINTIDPAFDINNSLDLYSKILNYEVSIQTKDNLGDLKSSSNDSLFQFFQEEKVNNTSIGGFCKNFEPFVKKVYYILEENQSIPIDNLIDHTVLHTLTPFLSVLNKVKIIYLDQNQKEVYNKQFAAKNSEGIPITKINPQTNSNMYKRLYPSSLSFDKYSDIRDSDLNSRYQNNFVLYLVKAIILKNEQSHQAPEKNRSNLISCFNATLIAKLFIINFFSNELINAIKKFNYTNNDIEAYINSEINRTKKQSSKFVSLALKELTKNNVTEYTGFIDEITNKNRPQFRILGHGGSGKTTTLEHLLYNDLIKWTQNPSNSKIPVLVFLANISSQETLIENIASKINTSTEYIEELIETNELIIYLDGVNEIVSNIESKKRILQEISSLIEDNPNLRVIVTDRYEFDSYQSNMFNISTFLIQRLNTSQINEFVKNYCNNSEEQTQKVLSALNSKKNISDLFLRPLVLTRAIEIIKIENDLPETEGKIIEKFVDILLRREKDEKKDPLLNISNFKMLLAYTANEIWSKYQTNAPIHFFKFNKILVEGAIFLGLETHNAGYISRIGYELEILSKKDDLIQFYHQSYIEFFCKHFLKYDLY